MHEVLRSAPWSGNRSPLGDDEAKPEIADGPRLPAPIETIGEADNHDVVNKEIRQLK